MGDWDGFGSTGKGRGLTAIALASALMACGGKSFDNDGSDPDPNPGGTGQGGSGNKAGSASGGSGKAGGSSMGGSAQGGSPTDACTALDDQPGSHIEVVIYNRTAVPIYLGQAMVDCSVAPLYEVRSADGALLPGLGYCRSSCQSLRTSSPAGCPAICAFPSSVRLLPDEVLYTSWDALYQAQAQLPQECVAGDFDASVCDQARRIQPGVFTFSARAGLSIDCSLTTGTECGPCTQEGDGCTTPGSLIAGMILNTSSTVTVDTNWGVDSAGQPGPLPPNNPGAGAPVPAPRVELFFTDQ